MGTTRVITTYDPAAELLPATGPNPGCTPDSGNHYSSTCQDCRTFYRSVPLQPHR